MNYSPYCPVCTVEGISTITTWKVHLRTHENNEIIDALLEVWWSPVPSFYDANQMLVTLKMPIHPYRQLNKITECPVCGTFRSGNKTERRAHLEAHPIDELIEALAQRLRPNSPTPSTSSPSEQERTQQIEQAMGPREHDYAMDTSSPIKRPQIRIIPQASMLSSALDEKFKLPEKYTGSEHTVWSEFIELAKQVNPLDLGQSFPDFAAPKHVKQALCDVARSENALHQQNCRGEGHVRLVNVLSKLYSSKIGREINPLTEVITTAGAYEALYSAILGHVHPGDEVILIEPCFDCYEPMVKAAGGRSVFVPLKPNKNRGKIRARHWVFDPSEMAAAFNEKTKAIIVNNPHNPLGKVFTREELHFIGHLCVKWQVMIICDEVYEWLVFEPNEHIRMASLPGMWDLTVTIGSGGETFSVTGWKIGWAYGPTHLISNLKIVHQNNLNSISTPTQEALARCLELEFSRIDTPQCYLTSLARDLKPKRDFMASFFTQIGMVPTIPDAGYFMMVDWTPLESKVTMNEETDAYRDYRFAKWLSKNYKLQGIPTSAFYSVPHKNLGERYIRFCYFKKYETLHKAQQILKAWVSGQEGAMM